MHSGPKLDLPMMYEARTGICVLSILISLGLVVAYSILNIDIIKREVVFVNPECAGEIVISSLARG